MVINGLDTSAAPPSFPEGKPGRVLLLDGDGHVYTAAATAKKLETAKRRWIQQVLTDLFYTECEYAEVHLTAADCAKAHRALYPTFLPYQGQRKGKAKPPLVQPLREHLAVCDDLPPEIEVVLNRYWEADDSLIMRGCLLPDSIIKSADKDLRMATSPYWEDSAGTVDTIDNRLGWVAMKYTEAGSPKVIGHGMKFFWAQMLMGDTADHIKGLHKLDGRACGPASAFAFVEPFTDESALANAVLWRYVKVKQNALAEAECLYLRTHSEDSAAEYILSLDLDPPLRRWVTQLSNYHTELLLRRIPNEEAE